MFRKDERGHDAANIRLMLKGLGVAAIAALMVQAPHPAHAGREAITLIKKQLEKRAIELRRRRSNTDQDWFESNNWRRRAKQPRRQDAVAPKKPRLPSWGEIPVGEPVGAGTMAEQLRHQLKRVNDWSGARKSLEAFYKARDYQPAWIANGRLTANAVAAIRYMGQAQRDGLNPNAYLVPNPRNTYTTNVSIAHADVILSRSIASYARHASGGRVHPGQISESISLKPAYADATVVLKRVQEAMNPASVLSGYHPQHPGYLALREQLNKRLGNGPVASLPQATPVQIPPGKVMKLGVNDPRVARLRQRLGLPADVDDPSYFGDDVLVAVRDYQEANQLTVDGIVGRGTLRKLNGEDGKRRASIGDIIANMETWRWMPKTLGDFHIAVNIPEFRVRVMDKGVPFHSTRVIVGKTSHKTPVFSDKIEYVAVNPTWNVPKSITIKEIIPELLKNPNYLRKSRLEVVRGFGSNTRKLDPSRIDWAAVTADNIDFRLREPPNERNALGRIKFMFPNKHAVYLHDTPTKKLFGRSSRAYSHGCVRVQNPMDFASALLTYDRKVNPEKINAAIGTKEKNLYLSQHIPVHLGYFTVRVDQKGQLLKFADVYGHHKRLKKRLDL